jgi:hypothetical protein
MIMQPRITPTTAGFALVIRPTMTHPSHERALRVGAGGVTSLRLVARARCPTVWLGHRPMRGRWVGGHLVQQPTTHVGVAAIGVPVRTWEG